MKRKPWLERLRKDFITDPVLQDKRSKNGSLLGHSFEWVCRTGINGGQADFDSHLEGLSPRDRALLYAYVNQKGHVDELIHAFTRLGVNMEDFRNATIVDIGCGPFTAGLALANVVGNAYPFRYFGIDRAQSMLDFGQELAEAVISANEFHSSTTLHFENDLDKAEFGPRRAADTTFFVLSYLLASETINTVQLVEQITSACTKISLGRVVVLYTNTARLSARVNFQPFCDSLINAGFEKHIEQCENFEDADRPRDIHYALFVRSPKPLSIKEFA
jgi:hypothetical protein